MSPSASITKSNSKHKWNLAKPYYLFRPWGPTHAGPRNELEGINEHIEAKAARKGVLNISTIIIIIVVVVVAV